MGFGHLAGGAHAKSACASGSSQYTLYRYFKSWFGGGGDLTPLLPDEPAGRVFHEAMKAACDKHDRNYYPKYKKWCDEYFYLPHRDEPRGAGGIFYDNLDSDDWERRFYLYS